jgi:MoxR-like ATPase
VLAAKARALLQGRMHVAIEDVRAIAHPVLRHRLVTTYAAEAEGISTDKIVDGLLATVAADPTETLRDKRLPNVLDA